MTALRDAYAAALLRRLEEHTGPVADAERYMERLDVLAGVDLEQKRLSAPVIETAPLSIEERPPVIEYGSGQEAEPDPLPVVHEESQQAPVSASAGGTPEMAPVASTTPAAPSPEKLTNEAETAALLNTEHVSSNGSTVVFAGKVRSANRCIDCQKGIAPQATRCRDCSGLARRKPLHRDIPAPTVAKLCGRCGGRMSFERTATGDEWTCTACGNVFYGEGFTPLDKADEAQRSREPSHAGSRL